MKSHFQRFLDFFDTELSCLQIDISYISDNSSIIDVTIRQLKSPSSERDPGSKWLLRGSIFVLALIHSNADKRPERVEHVELPMTQVRGGAPTADAVAQESTNSASNSRSTEAPAVVAAPFKHLLDEYQSPGSKRGFVLRAVANPANGAAWYAALVVSECQGLSRETDVLTAPQPDLTPDADGPAYTRKITVFNAWQQRCADFVPGELDALAKKLTAKDIRDSDPLTKAITTFMEARRNADIDSRKQALASLMNTNDPLVIGDIGWRIGLYDNGADGPQFYYKGQRYSVRTDSDVLAAVELIPCGMGLQCDATQGLIAMNCLRGAECFENRFDALRDGIMKDDPKRYAKAIALYEQMVASIKSGAVDDFIRR